jgi:hypothetical protein
VLFAHHKWYEAQRLPYYDGQEEYIKRRYENLRTAISQLDANQTKRFRSMNHMLPIELLRIMNGNENEAAAVLSLADEKYALIDAHELNEREKELIQKIRYDYGE